MDKNNNYSKKKENSKIRKKRLSKEVKVSSNVKSEKKVNVNSKKTRKRKIDINKYFSRANVCYLMLLILDLSLIIWFASKNIVNYVVTGGETIFVSKYRYMLFGRNYINVVLILLFYVYFLSANKWLLKRKNTYKFMVLLLIFLAIFNMVLFFIFTKRIY